MVSTAYLPGSTPTELWALPHSISVSLSCELDGMLADEVVAALDGYMEDNGMPKAAENLWGFDEESWLASDAPRYALTRASVGLVLRGSPWRDVLSHVFCRSDCDVSEMVSYAKRQEGALSGLTGQASQ